MMNQAVSLCEIAQERYRNAALWLNLWTGLLWVFGGAIVGFLVWAIMAYLRADFLPGAVATLGTIADGLAIKWVVVNRNRSRQEEKEAYEEVGKACGGTSVADQLRVTLGLPRRTP